MGIIDKFLENKEKNTQKNYRWILNEYFRELKQNPETYFKNNRDYEEDVKEWWKNHLDEVPLTRNTKLNILKSFLEEYDLTFPKKFWKKQRKMRKGNRAATLDRVPSKQEFKKILQHGTIKDKALFLFAASSGMRINEILKLTPEMVNLDVDPPRVNIPGNISKTGDPRITFLTGEAKEYLLEWYKIRDDYLQLAIRKTKHVCKKTRNDNSIFPFHYNIAWTRWVYLLKKAKLDERDPTTNRHVLHIHCLRKWFLSQLKLEIPHVIAEAIAGHEQYLDDAYRRFTKEQIADYYKKGRHNLMVMNVPPDLSDINKQMKERETRIRQLEEQIQTKNIAQEIISNPAFRTEMMNLLKKEMENEKK